MTKKKEKKRHILKGMTDIRSTHPITKDTTTSKTTISSTEGRYDITESWEHYHISLMTDSCCTFWISTHKFVECSHQFSRRKTLAEKIRYLLSTKWVKLTP